MFAGTKNDVINVIQYKTPGFHALLQEMGGRSRYDTKAVVTVECACHNSRTAVVGYRKYQYLSAAGRNVLMKLCARSGAFLRSPCYATRRRPAAISPGKI